MTGHTKKRASASKAQQRANREHGLSEIIRLLGEGPKTAIDLADLLKIHHTTSYLWLRLLEVGPRTVRKSGEHRDGRALWELGTDTTLPSPDELLDQSMAQRQRTVPARQIGMRRDDLMASLFGPPTAPAGAQP